MDRVAVALGVHRRAVHYHVGDRETLLAEVANELYARALGAGALPASTDWRRQLRHYAEAVSEALRAAGPFAVHVRLSSVARHGALRLAEDVLQGLVGAGFELRDAVRALTLVNTFAFAVGQASAGHGRHPQENVYDALQVQVEGAVLAQPAADLPLLGRTVLELRDFPSAEDVDFWWDSLLAGLEQTLRARPPPP